jgi:3'-phosphoadenosine 5'-phosphosulfate sulfotransferase (PAPS reductase)/FAD synthetase
MPLSRNDAAEIYAQSMAFARRADSARAIVREALEKQITPLVALSGGKDSTVVLDLVRGFVPDIPAVWSDDVYYLPETGEYIDRLEQNGVNVHHIRTNAKHTEWYIVEGQEWNDIDHYAKQQFGAGLTFLGLRKEESAKRRIWLSKFGPLYFAESRDMWVCNPIYNWTWQDVWGYIVSNELDYNRAYDKLEELGIEPNRQRIGPFAVERVLWTGQLSLLKRGWPQEFARFAKDFPEALSWV